MAVETNARIEFSVASVEEWEKVNPRLHQGEPVFAKKPSGKYILKVGAPGGSTYKNAVVVWDQDDAETKMTSTQEAAAQALASKNAASASASAAKSSENAAAASKSAAATSAENAKTSETNAAASKTAAANSASTASANATASANSASAAATSERNAAASASAASTSESNAMKSASAANTSAGNAKGSETNASASASAAKSSENAAAASKSAAATSAENAKTSETNAAASKTAAANSASNSASSASASATSASKSASSASASASSASTATQKATAAASSATAAATSASNAATSATNAKASETKAASSASAAKDSADRASTWDPTNYTKTIMVTKPDNDGHRCLMLLEEISEYDKYNYYLSGGSFSIYPFVRAGNNPHMSFPPIICALSLPYEHVANYGYMGWTTNCRYTPIVVRNNTTNKVYWGLSVYGSGQTALIFGAFKHNIAVIDTLLSDSDDDVYDGYTVLHKAEAITPAKASDIPTALSQLTNDANFAKTSEVPTKMSQMTDYEAEVKKWKDAYNNLRKRSTPAQFDDAELTELMLGAVGSGNITLLQPYTNFDGLLIYYTADNGNFLSNAYISTAELNRRVAVAKSVDATGIFLFDNRYFWTIFITEATNFSPTYFPYENDNCIIQQIYGVKLKEIT